jgi:hypothetical protein
MVYQGTVQNGVIVFPAGVQLPEGAAVDVTVVLPMPGEKSSEATDAELDSVFRMGELAVDTGIPDLGLNINHYLYGHPKVKDAS